MTAYPQSSASIRTNIPTLARIHAADTHTPRPLPESPRPTLRTTTPQTAKAIRPQSTRQTRRRCFALRAPFPPASGIFLCRSLCPQQWPPKPTDPVRAPVLGAFRSYPSRLECAGPPPLFQRQIFTSTCHRAITLIAITQICHPACPGRIQRRERSEGSAFLLITALHSQEARTPS